jgi:hypothetical protein
MWRFYKAIRPLPGFNVDEPSGTIPYSAELFATVRDSGRFLEDVRVSLGGAEIYEAEFKLKKVVDDSSIGDWSIKIQKWPRDVELRKGLLSSLWADIPALVSARDAQVFDGQGAGIPPAEFLRMFGEAMDGKALASVRWAIILNDRGRLATQLQALPSSAAILNGKPSLKRYYKVCKSS